MERGKETRKENGKEQKERRNSTGEARTGVISVASTTKGKTAAGVAGEHIVAISGTGLGRLGCYGTSEAGFTYTADDPESTDTCERYSGTEDGRPDQHAFAALFGF